MIEERIKLINKKVHLTDRSKLNQQDQDHLKLLEIQCHNYKHMIINLIIINHKDKIKHKGNHQV